MIRPTSILALICVASSVASAQDSDDAADPTDRAYIKEVLLDPHRNWDPPPVHGAEPWVMGGEDRAVDIGVWFEQTGVHYWEGTTWVYVAGVMSNAVGGRYWCVARYPAEDPRNPALWKFGFYPNGYQTTTRRHEPRALGIDPDTGDVYVTGFATKPAGDTDYVTVKYTKTLLRDLSWGSSSVLTYAGEGGGDDFAVDIGIYGYQGDRYVAITGSALDDEHGYDIVTMMYYTRPATLQARQPGDPDAWTDWRSVYDHPTQHGDDLATELGGTILVEDETGFAVAVAGTTWGGPSRFDMVALTYMPRTGALRFPPAMYNGPANGDDVCTGLATHTWHVNAALVLCGSTKALSGVTGDTEYLCWAVSGSNGLPLWGPDKNVPSFGYGRAWSPPSADHGADVARDIAYGLDGQTVFVTGSAMHNGDFDAGTVEFALVEPNGGDLLNVSLYDSPNDPGADDHGTAIAYSPNVGLYAAGSSGAGGAVLTLRYGSGLTVDAVGRYEGSRLGGTATALALHVDLGYPVSGSGVYVTGTTTRLHDGPEWVVLRYRWAGM